MIYLAAASHCTVQPMSQVQKTHLSSCTASTLLYLFSESSTFPESVRLDSMTGSGEGMLGAFLLLSPLSNGMPSSWGDTRRSIPESCSVTRPPSVPPLPRCGGLSAADPDNGGPEAVPSCCIS